jgi:hypothetical protein
MSVRLREEVQEVSWGLTGRGTWDGGRESHSDHAVGVTVAGDGVETALDASPG